MSRATRRHLGGKFSEGARRLWGVARYRDRHANVATTVRLTLGIKSRGIVDRWIYGDRVPSMRYLLAIQAAFRVPARLWFEPPRRAFAPPNEDALAAA